MGRVTPLEECGIHANTGCCYECPDADRQFMETEIAETGSVHVMQFLRAGIARAVDGTWKSTSGAPLNAKQKKIAAQ